MSVFIEERLLDCVAYGTSGGPTFRTRKVALQSGVIRRNPFRARPLYRYGILYRNLTPEDHDTVIAAFNACYGGVNSFRLKDWSDFSADNELLSALGAGAPQSIQLTKAYTFGVQGISRSIRKPVSGTVVIYANGVPISASIDHTTGVATFTASNGAILRWSGEFDVPVMFEQDELQFSANSRGKLGLFLTADVSLIEDISA